MGKKEKIIIASIVVAFMALVLGVTYAWFNVDVNGNGNTMTVTTAELSIEYRDGNEISRSNWFPGESITKTFEVENTGTDTVFYDINFVIDTNTFERDELVYTLTSPTGANIVETPVPTSTGLVINAIALPFNQTHTYELTITFKEMSINQNQNQRQNFTGTIEIEADYLYTAGGLSFEGQLTNALGEAEVNALMTLHSDPKQTRTDANGYYKFENVSPGGHTLTVQTEGGETKEMSIHILSGATNEVQENSLVIKDKIPVNIRVGETLELERPPQVGIYVNNGTSDRALVPYLGVTTPVIITPLSGYTTAEPTITCTNGTTYTYSTNTLIITGAEEDSSCTVTLQVDRKTVTISVTGGTSNKTSMSLTPSESDTAVITPNTGYKLENATISCTSGISGSINTTTGVVTVSNVTTPGTCNINLPLITYPIATAIQQKYTAQSDANINFSYTSAGCNDNTSCSAGTVEDASQVTNGLYINNKQNISGDSTLGKIKYFRGNVNNYVRMGTYPTTLYYSGGYVYNNITVCETARGVGNCTIYATEGEPIIWRVIRIDNDNTVRIITDKTAIPTSCYSYNCINSNPMYVGYTINDTNTNRTDGNMGTDSQLKSLLDTWYAENLAEEYGSKIKQNAEYCNDTTSVQEGSNVFFIPRGRTYNAQTPTFSCPTTNKTYGGLYQLPIATITSDEEAYAGGRYKAVNQSYFLNNYTGYWTLTPCQYYSTWGTDMWTTSSGYVEAYNSSNNLSARPVVTLNANVQVSGEGTSTSPWVVQ